MSYRDQLSPWCIVRLLPNAQCSIVDRFRRHGDAEQCLKAIRKLNPNQIYEIVFKVDSLP